MRSISASLGGVAVKGLFLAEREGHPPPRIVETPGGMLNAIGLQGIGVHRFVAEKLPELRRLGATVVVNICGSTIDEYCEVARVLSDAEGVAALELNISCPNIKEGGIQFGCSLTGTHDVVQRCPQGDDAPGHSEAHAQRHRRRVVCPCGRRGGRGCRVAGQHVSRDGHRRRNAPSEAVERARRTERPGIRPIAVRMVWECYQAVKLPIIGMGGIATADDALEFIIAGASAVQVGTANFVDPFIWSRLIDGLMAYLTRHRLARIADLVGSLEIATKEHA